MGKNFIEIILLLGLNHMKSQDYLKALLSYGEMLVF